MLDILLAQTASSAAPQVMAAAHSSVVKLDAIAARTLCTAPILETHVAQVMEHAHLVGVAAESATAIH